MSAGGDSGQKGPAVSAQEAQMQAIMQQARVTIHARGHTRAHTKFPRDFLTSNVGVTSLKNI